MNTVVTANEDKTEAAPTTTLSQSTREKLTDFIVALSLTNLCFIRSWFRALTFADFGFFNSMTASAAAMQALILNMSVFTLLAWVVMRLRRRSHNKIFRFGVHMAFFGLLCIPVLFIRSSIDPHKISNQWLFHPLGITTVVVIFVCALRWHQWIARKAAVVLGILSPLAFLTMGKITLSAMGLMSSKGSFEEQELRPLRAADSLKPRVVWLVFDEFDYRLVFEQRPPGLVLPELDQLRGSSVFATHAYPPGGGTIISMPALITGRFLTNVVIEGTSRLVLEMETGEETSWRRFSSIFTAAQDEGFNTALVGWHLPYSRIVAKDLNYCAWFPNPGYEPARAKTFRAAAFRQMSCLISPIHFQRGYVNLHRDALEEALSVVTNQMYGLTLYHSFVPHEPGIFLPEKNSYSLLGQAFPPGYFNNLALLDKDLGLLRRAMEKEGLWERSWVIVSADHGWRTSDTYDGKIDIRIPFMVKAPGDSKSIEYSNRFNTVITYDLILAILRRQVESHDDVVKWLGANGVYKHPAAAPPGLSE
jgi:hypothetical protein